MMVTFVTVASERQNFFSGTLFIFSAEDDSTVLAIHPSTRFLDGYKVKMTGKNCQNYTIGEEMYGQLCKNRGKTRAVVYS